jgi:hypothetical protein
MDRRTLVSMMAAGMASPFLRGTAAELPTAISCLGAFPTPAARACGLIRDCQRPKTCTMADISGSRYRLRLQNYGGVEVATLQMRWST